MNSYSNINNNNNFYTSSNMLSCNAYNVEQQQQQQQQQKTVVSLYGYYQTPAAHYSSAPAPNNNNNKNNHKSSVSDLIACDSSSHSSSGITMANNAAASASASASEINTQIPSTLLLADVDNKPTQTQDKDITTTIRSEKETTSTTQIILKPTQDKNERKTMTTMIVPKSKNPTGSDAIIPTRSTMKMERKLKTGVGAAAGVIVGGLLTGPLFPVGMVLGGAIGGVATKEISKAGERHKQRLFETHNFREYAAKECKVVKCNAVFV